MISFCQFLFATTIIYVLSVNGASNFCPDGQEDIGNGCEACKEGLFRNGDMRVCRIFKTCDSSHQKKLFHGNATHDVVCHCPTEPFTILKEGLCHPTCPAGKYFTEALCQPCPPGKWKNFTGKDECSSCTQCSKILHECNSTHDAVCAPGEFTTESNKNNGSADGDPSADASSSNPGPIIGIVFGAIVVAAVVIACVVFGYRKYMKHKSRSSKSANRPSSYEVEPLVPSTIGDENPPVANANSQNNHQGTPNGRQQSENNNPNNADEGNETSGQPITGSESNHEVVPSAVVTPSPSPEHDPGPQQNGDQNRSNANADSQGTSTNQQRTHDGFQQNGNNPNNADVELNPEVVPSAVVTPSLLPEHDPGPQQNLNPNQPMANDLQVNRPMSSTSLQPNPGPALNLNPNQPMVIDSLASGIRDREVPVHQSGNAGQWPNDNTQKKNNSLEDANKPQISGQPSCTLNRDVGPQGNRPTSSVSFQLSPAHDSKGQPSSLCTNPIFSISSDNNVSFPGVAAAQTTLSFQQPVGEDKVDLRDERPSTTGRLSSSSQPRTSALPEDLWDYEGCMTDNYILIRTYLTSLGYILGSLLQDRIFTHPQMLEIKEIERNRSKGDAIDKMIELMRLKGNRGFECFIKALVIPDVRLDKLAHEIHPQLAERFINERAVSEGTEDQDSETESPRKASSEGKDEVDFGKSRADETKIKTVGSDETHIKATGLDETKMKTIDSDETKIKIIDSDVTEIKTVDSDLTKIKTID